MWHAFTIFPADLEVTPELRNAAVPPRARLTYGERVVRWFKEAPGETFKQPVLDPGKGGPGVIIEREAAHQGHRLVRCRLERAHASPHVLEGSMTCSTSGWRSPREWQFAQNFVGAATSPLLPELVEAGTWDGSAVKRTATARNGSMTTALAAPRLIALHAWLADFPTDLAPTAWAANTVVMEDMTLFSSGAAIGMAGSEIAALPFTAGLRGFLLRFGGGLPYEFWVNAHGTVVYLCAGPTRVFVLENVETLS